MSQDSKTFGYRLDENDVITWRLFAGEDLPDGWVDSPTKLFATLTSKDGLKDLDKDALVNQAMADGYEVSAEAPKDKIIAAIRYPDEGGSAMPGFDQRQEEANANVTAQEPEMVTLEEARQNAAKAGGLPTSGFVQQEEPVRAVLTNAPAAAVVVKEPADKGDVKPPAKPAAKTAAAKSEPEDKFTGMTKEELLDEAKRSGVTVHASDSKAVILDALRNAE